MSRGLETTAMLDEETAGILDEDDQPESSSPKQTKGRPVLKFGLAFFAVGTIGLVALYQTGSLPFGRALTPAEHVKAFHQKVFNSDFTHRVLQAAAEATDFEASVEGWMKEVDTPDPKAMSMISTLLNDPEEEMKAPKIVEILEAKKGQAHHLARVLTDTWEYMVMQPCEARHGPPKSHCEDMRGMITVQTHQNFANFGEGELVSVTMNGPEEPHPHAAFKEMKDAVAEHKPKFVEEVHFGRDMQGMYDHEHDNLIKVINGMGIKISAAFASTVFDALADSVRCEYLGPMLHVAKGFLKYKGREELLYKHDDDLAGAFDYLPNMESLLDQVSAMLKSEPEFMEKVGDVAHHLKSTRGVLVEGLPGGWELRVNFKNVNPAPLLMGLYHEDRKAKQGMHRH